MLCHMPLDYALHDAADDCLYVGMTSDLKARLRVHSKKEWYPRVSRVTVVQVVGTRHDALRAEDEMIERLRPTFNWIGTEMTRRYGTGRTKTATRAEILGANT